MTENRTLLLNYHSFKVNESDKSLSYNLDLGNGIKSYDNNLFNLLKKIKITPLIQNRSDRERKSYTKTTTTTPKTKTDEETTPIYVYLIIGLIILTIIIIIIQFLLFNIFNRRPSITFLVRPHSLLSKESTTPIYSKQSNEIEQSSSNMLFFKF